MGSPQVDRAKRTFLELLTPMNSKGVGVLCGRNVHTGLDGRELEFEVKGSRPTSSMVDCSLATRVKAAYQDKKGWLLVLELGTPVPGKKENLVRQIDRNGILKSIALGIYELFNVKVPNNYLYFREVQYPYIKGSAILEKCYDLGIRQALVLVLKDLPEYLKLREAQVFSPGLNSAISIAAFIQQNKSIPEKIQTPDGRSVPINGLVEVLAVAKILGEQINFDHLGLESRKDADGNIISYECVKIGQGIPFQFSFVHSQSLLTQVMPGKGKKPALEYPPPTKNIVVGEDSVITKNGKKEGMHWTVEVQWDHLTPGQQERYIAVLDSASRLTRDAYKQLFCRDSFFPPKRDFTFTSKEADSVGRIFKKHVLNLFKLYEGELKSFREEHQLMQLLTKYINGSRLSDEESGSVKELMSGNISFSVESLSSIRRQIIELFDHQGDIESRAGKLIDLAFELHLINQDNRALTLLERVSMSLCGQYGEADVSENQLKTCLIMGIILARLNMFEDARNLLLFSLAPKYEDGRFIIPIKHVHTMFGIYELARSYEAPGPEQDKTVAAGLFMQYIKVCEPLKECSDSYILANYSLGQILVDKKEYLSAALILKKACDIGLEDYTKLPPDFKEKVIGLRFLLGEAYAHMHTKDMPLEEKNRKAFYAYREFLELHETHLPVDESRAKALFMMGQLLNVRKFYRSSITACRDAIRIYKHVAEERSNDLLFKKEIDAVHSYIDDIGKKLGRKIAEFKESEFNPNTHLKFTEAAF